MRKTSIRTKFVIVLVVAGSLLFGSGAAKAFYYELESPEHI
jgi:hypothetical protein